MKWKEGAAIKSGAADYLLCTDGWAISVIEAKPAGHTLEGVVIQSKRYTEGLDGRVPTRYRPLPFACESTGEVTQFSNGLDPTRAAGKYSPSTARKSWFECRTRDRSSCAGHSSRCRDCPEANYGPFSTRSGDPVSRTVARPRTPARLYRISRHNDARPECGYA